MKNRFTSIMFIILLMIGGFVGFVNLGSENTQGTFVSGIIYDGSGGPWTPAGSPYIVLSDVTVPMGEILTIEPGVKVKFDGYYSIYVNGNLMAIGTKMDRINITSNIVPSANMDWRDIRINSAGHAEIKYCNISFAFTGINLYSSNNNLTNNNLMNNNYGIDVRGSSNNNITNNNLSSNDAPCIRLHPSSSNNIIANNIISYSEWGLSLTGSSNISITNNNISNNFRGISLMESSYITITNNNFVNDGVFLDGNQLLHYNSHHIPDDNIINGKPLLYHKDRNNINIVGIPVGQVILANCSVIELRDLQVYNVDRGIQIFYSNDILITDNTISSCDLDGILLFELSNSTISYNNVTNNGGGIRLGTSSNNIVLKNNVSWNNHNGGFWWGILVGSSSNTIIVDNYVCNNDIGIGVATSSSNNTIINNNISNNNQAIELAWSPSENVIEWNTISSNNEYGISLTLSAINNVIRRNNISNCGYGIIVKSSARNNMIDSNDIYNNLNGSYFEDSSNNSLTNNYIFNNDNGINLQASSDNEIKGNIISSNNYNGILNWMSSNNISHNEISDNFYGIQIAQDSQNTTLKCNNIFNNEYGIYVGWTIYNNLIFHNNIINNTNQAYDETMAKTYWDDDYPSGGNYWSDYTGIDLNTTPSQNVPPSDGIGDTPYTDIIGGFSPLDNYPLMYPWICEKQLYYGWSLISIPRIQSDTDLESVLSSIYGYYDAVQYYVSSDAIDHWKHNHISKPSELKDLSDINHTMGIWIHVTEPNGVVLEYNGLPIRQSQSIPLHIGWNLVGFPSSRNLDVITGLNNIDYDSELNIIQTYNALTKSWEEIGPSDYFEIGKGYWIHSNVEKVWNVPL